jgi:Rad3-related DNA helicase
MLNAVSVKTLAEFVHRRGDLYPALGGRVTGEEGIATQRRAQQGRGDGYQREVPVSDQFSLGELQLSVSGRVDGCDLTAPLPFVEEIKTTRAEGADAERALGSAHWAQARLYAALLARDHPEQQAWQIRLLYCHPDTEAQACFAEERTTAWLADYLQRTLATYVGWLVKEQRYQHERNRWLEARQFPYGSFRAHQRALAGRVYQAFRDGEHLLLEAPTGSGKTMGVLYPSLKALAAGYVQRLFFLTSRGTGALAAMQAAADVAQGAAQIRVVELIAKEKACVVEGMPCDERCPYSVGYYDRIHDAVTDALQLHQMDRARIREVAEAHQVCPFELSLDVSLWADLIIGDYNYLLDPVVRLQRFIDDIGLGLLIDESHQLAERTRDMLTVALNREDVKAAIGESPPATIGRRLKSVDRTLMALRRDLLARFAEGEATGEVVVAPPEKLLRSAQKALEALAEEELDLAAWPRCLQVLFDLSRLLRAQSWATTGERPDELDAESAGSAILATEFRYLAEVTDRGRGRNSVRLRLACLDAAPYLESVLGSYGPHVRFSGTVTPLDLYQRLHGQAKAPSERVESPFAAEQLAALVVTDLPVYYRQRTASLPRLAELVRQTVSARSGNYLVALPSFEYLDQLAEVLANDGEYELLIQTPGLDEAARAEFLARFQDDDTCRLGLIVLGGLFAESVDFSHAPLAGVICVGVGLPPASRQKEEMRMHFDAELGNGGGDTVAYQQPAMTKVLQMAGRLLRSPDDRGVLLLIDDRFARASFQRFFPRHWQPISLRAADVPAQLEKFWQAVPGLPRLRTSNQPASNNRPSALQSQVKSSG